MFIRSGGGMEGGGKTSFRGGGGGRTESIGGGGRKSVGGGRKSVGGGRKSIGGGSCCCCFRSKTSKDGGGTSFKKFVSYAGGAGCAAGAGASKSISKSVVVAEGAAAGGATCFFSCFSFAAMILACGFGNRVVVRFGLHFISSVRGRSGFDPCFVSAGGREIQKVETKGVRTKKKEPGKRP